MVKNKFVGERASRSSTGKTKKDGSQTAGSNKDLPGLDKDNPAGSENPAVSAELQFTGQDQLGFPDRVYLLASIIFQNHHLEKPAAHRLVNYGKERGLPLPEGKDEGMQRMSYELAFNTLKYQELLEAIMIDSCFYLSQPMPDDQMCLVAVMLYDFQDRKFLPRDSQREEDMVEEVRDVENYLLRFKTKLAASLARCRIKHDLLTIECILPESLQKKQERSSSLPLYAWVNTQKSSLDEVKVALKKADFSQVESIGQLEGQTFCQDPHCGDMLVFPAQLKTQLHSTKLLSNHKLIIQDKSCSLGPNAVCSLLPEEADVLMVGCFSSLTVSHTAALVAEKHKADGSVQPTVYVCVRDRTDAQRQELQQAITALGCKHVKLIPEDFLSLNGGDKRLERVRVILLTPKCSVSAVSNPVEFLLQENGDTDLLQDLSQGSVAQSKLEALVAQQRKDIDHALKFPKVVSVVYSTCSSYPEENEAVVSRALEEANACCEQEREPKQANFRLSPSPFSIPNHAEGPEETHPFFMLQPSEQSNGCFLAVLNRVPEPVVKEEPSEVIVRANAKGILDKIGSNQPSKKEKHGHINRMKTNHSRTSLLSNQSKNQETSSSTSLGGHQEFINRRQSTQGKVKALRLQGSKNAVSGSYTFSKQEHISSLAKSESISSLAKPESSLPKRSVIHVPNTTTSTTIQKSITQVVNTLNSTSVLQPTPPPPPAAASPLAQVVRPRRPLHKALKPVVMVLPPAHFPTFFPPQNSRTSYSPSFRYNKWRPTAQNLSLARSGGSLSKEARVQSRHLF